MEPSSIHISRQLQFSYLYQELILSYNALKTAFEAQNQVLNDSKLEVINFKHQAHYWEAQFKQVKSREETLKFEIEELKAKLRKREKQLFGNRSEKQPSHNESITQTPASLKKRRGQQPTNASPKRRDYGDLPEIEEVVELREEEKHCPSCHLTYEELGGSEDSEILEIINVQAYRRVIRRKRYKRNCRCAANPMPQIITVPPMERVFPKSKLGISIWAHILIHKYEYQTPLNRILSNLSLCNLSLSTGTVTGGLVKLLDLLSPVYDAIAQKNLAADHWHADETGWKVFEKVEGKESCRWFLWIFKNKETVVYKISPSRSSHVLKEYFGEEHKGGILNVDRYSAYKVIAKSGLFLLAFCWAHVRRDFLEHSKAYSHQEGWGLGWIERIGILYHLNNQRIQCKAHSRQFQEFDKKLRDAIKAMAEQIKFEIGKPDLFPAAKKLMESLNRHWQGLTVFVDYPDIPMDNNKAERGLRSSVLGRKNYYGSGSIWSAELAAVMFTIFNTIKLWGINPHTWLLAYFQECAMRGGSPPDRIELFLPWNMNPTLRKLFAEPPKHEYERLLVTG